MFGCFTLTCQVLTQLEDEERREEEKREKDELEQNEMAIDVFRPGTAGIFLYLMSTFSFIFKLRHKLL